LEWASGAAGLAGAAAAEPRSDLQGGWLPAPGAAGGAGAPGAADALAQLLWPADGQAAAPMLELLLGGGALEGGARQPGQRRQQRAEAAAHPGPAASPRYDAPQLPLRLRCAGLSTGQRGGAPLSSEAWQTIRRSSLDAQHRPPNAAGGSSAALSSEAWQTIRRSSLEPQRRPPTAAGGSSPVAWQLQRPRSGSRSQ
jgi:hypothetical protein